MISKNSVCGGGPSITFKKEETDSKHERKQTRKKIQILITVMKEIHRLMW
jgi:hypothetical protein